MSRPHLHLVSDNFPFAPYRNPTVVEDYITILTGWQIAWATATLMMASALAGATGAYWLWLAKVV